MHNVAKNLMASGLLKREVALTVIEEANSRQIPFITLLIEKNILSPQKIAIAIAIDLGLPVFDLSYINSLNLAKELNYPQLMAQYQALPIFVRGKNLYIAIADPINLVGLDEFKFHTGLNTQAIIVEQSKLEHAIQHVNHIIDTDLARIDNENLEKLASYSTEAVDDIEINDANDNFVIKYINKIIFNAIQKKASDIHFEPYFKFYRIRFRIDGVLYEVAHPPANLAARIAARLKVMAKLDISERRVPQDGHFKVIFYKENAVEFRVNSCPTVYGEKIVLRLLDPTSITISIAQLGFSELQKKLFLKAIQRSQGMVLITGPTGSGKTASLYTGLNILNTNERNIITVEDPVELYVKGINQVGLNLKAELTFANALRAFLRQDPDIIMIGEIRDIETAEIAIKAAQTGHLVLSTLHTNSAAETLTRLANMGVPTYNVATSINLIVAQRLARILCKHCKKAVNYPKTALLEMGYQEQDIITTNFYEPQKCEQCTHGYLGRIGIYEALEITAEIGQIIMAGGTSLDIYNEAKKQNMQTLRESALQKAKEGLISLSEVNRIT